MTEREVEVTVFESDRAVVVRWLLEKIASSLLSAEARGQLLNHTDDLIARIALHRTRATAELQPFLRGELRILYEGLRGAGYEGSETSVVAAAWVARATAELRAELEWVRGAKDAAEKARETHWREVEQPRAALAAAEAERGRAEGELNELRAAAHRVRDAHDRGDATSLDGAAIALIEALETEAVSVHDTDGYHDCDRRRT